MSPFIASVIGGATGSLITVFGSFFKPFLDYHWEEWKRKKKLKPRKDRLLSILKPSYDSNGNVFIPQYELSMLSAAVGLSEQECMDLLVSIDAWGYKNEQVNQWSLSPHTFYPDIKV